MEKTGKPNNLLIKDHNNGNIPQLPLFFDKKTSSTETTNTALPPPNDASLLVRILCFLALFPGLYSIQTFVLSPLAHFLGHALLQVGGKNSTVVTGGIETGMKSFGKRELEKGSAEFGVFAALIPILVIL